MSRRKRAAPAVGAASSSLPFSTRMSARPARGVTPGEYGISCQVPFDTHDGYEVTNRYLHLRTLDLLPPRHYAPTFLEGLRLGNSLSEYLEVLGLTQYFNNQWEGHDILCLEMLCTARLGKNTDEGQEEETAFLCNLGGIFCEVSCYRMHEIFGFHYSDDASQFVPHDFNYFDAWRDLTGGCTNWGPRGASAMFIRDNALLLLHRFLAFNVTGKIEGSKVSGPECYLLWAAKNHVPVSISHFIWNQIIGNQSRHNAHPTLSQIATAIARYMGVRFYPIPPMAVVPSREITPAELINGSYLASRTQFKPWHLRSSVSTYIAIHGVPADHEEPQGDDMDEGAAAAQPEEPPAYFRNYQEGFNTFQTGLFERLDSHAVLFQSMTTNMENLGLQMQTMGTRVQGVENRVYDIERHLSRYTDFHPTSSSSSQAPWDPNDPNDPRNFHP